MCLHKTKVDEKKSQFNCSRSNWQLSPPRRFPTKTSLHRTHLTGSPANKLQNPRPVWETAIGRPPPLKQIQIHKTGSTHSYTYSQTSGDVSNFLKLHSSLLRFLRFFPIISVEVMKSTYLLKLIKVLPTERRLKTRQDYISGSWV